MTKTKTKTTLTSKSRSAAQPAKAAAAGDQPAAQQKRIFIVDDHPLFREGLAGIIRQRPDLVVCGEADDAAKAFDQIRALRPDILLTDIGLPGKSGLELLKDLQAFRPELPVLVISMHDEALYAERVLKAGGRGYIMKQAGPEKILGAIDQVLAGKVCVSERMSADILEHIASPSSKSKVSPIGKLTDREFEILRLIGEGKDGHRIAKELNLSLKTVNCHRSHIKEKLGLPNFTALIHFAARWVGEKA